MGTESWSLLRRAAAAVSIVVFCSVVVACGSGARGRGLGSSPPAASALRWSNELVAWHRTLLHALDGISVLFSTQVSVADLLNERSPASRALIRDEVALAHCSAAISRLGPAPAALDTAEHYALEACVNLQEGARLVLVAVHEVRTGAPLNPLAAATGPLYTGQAEAAAAAQASSPAP
jgi:hypothetical protein